MQGGTSGKIGYRSSVSSCIPRKNTSNAMNPIAIDIRTIQTGPSIDARPAINAAEKTIAVPATTFFMLHQGNRFRWPALTVGQFVQSTKEQERADNAKHKQARQESP